MPENYSIVPKDKICVACVRHEANFKVTYGRHLGTTLNPHIITVTYVCELCLIDYVERFKELGMPYKIEENPEVVQF